MHFRPLPPTLVKVLQVAKAAGQFLLPFADRISTPAEFFSCPALTAWDQEIDNAAHSPSGLGSFQEKGFSSQA